tara:strand:+ start:814 stop:1131 length:318 start_codon:yes stop_codon:yes gene_type:complete
MSYEPTTAEESKSMKDFKYQLEVIDTETGSSIILKLGTAHYTHPAANHSLMKSGMDNLRVFLGTYKKTSTDRETSTVTWKVEHPKEYFTEAELQNMFRFAVIFIK